MSRTCTAPPTGSRTTNQPAVTNRPARWDVALADFPFTDLSAVKVRPVVVLAMSGTSDLVAAFITSRPQPARFDHVEIAPEDPEFRVTGLHRASVVRISRLATLDASLLVSRLGTVGPATRSRILTALRLLLL